MYSSVWTYPITNMSELEKKMAPVFNRFQSYPRPASQIFQLVLSQLKLEAKYLIIYDIDDALTTKVGTVDSIREYESVLIMDAENGSIMDNDTAIFLGDSTLKDSGQIPAITCPITRGSFNIDLTSLTRIVKNYLIQSNVRTVTYRGRNNHTYTKTWTPKNKNISIRETTKVFLPKYFITINSINQNYNCNLIQNDTAIKIESTNLFNCKTCNKSINKKILLCNDCGKVTHAPKLFNSHGFACKNCKKTMCKDGAYWFKRFIFFKKIVCESCANILSTTTGKDKKKLVP